MEGQSPKLASTPTGAVFLSYASEDAESAARICEALRAGGIEVWFDQSELRGGDAWDRRIREQIHGCRLFIALISAHTEARDEGYFRREWKLAVERTHDMAEKKAFLVPVVIDGTTERGASVPEKFREVQWTRLLDGETSPAFVAQIQKLLVPAAPTRAAAPTPSGSTMATASQEPSAHPTWPSNALWGVGVLLAIGLAYLGADRVWRPQHSQATFSQKPASGTSAAPSTGAAFSPPPHSIAVLPFVNMSGDKEQEYFSDGLTEEILNSLARIKELQVAGRTSSFYFKGEHADLASIAHKLNVAAVLEGSVRRSGHTVRVTAQLINAATGFHLWSETYDRGSADIFKLQTDLATAVASALKVNLLGDVAEKMELGGTQNPEAFDAYLRALKTYFTWRTEGDVQRAIAGYTAAIRQDPHYALAYAARSLANRYVADEFTKGAAVRDYADKALADARTAISLAPDLAEGHVALAHLLAASQEFSQASEEYDRAVALAPGSARVLSQYGYFAVAMGQTAAGIAAARRSVVLDPLNSNNRYWLGVALVIARRYAEAAATFKEADDLDPNSPYVNGWLSYAYYMSGDLERAGPACAREAQWNKFLCMALLLGKQGQHSEARATLAKVEGAQGHAPAVFYALCYVDLGDRPTALDWLETAMREHSSDLVFLKAFEAFDPLRKEPRFQAVMRELKFPE